MNSQLLVLSIGVSAAVACAMVGIVLVARSLSMRTARQRLHEVSGDDVLDDSVTPLILRDMNLSSSPLLNALLERLPFVRQLDTILAQGDLSIRIGPFLLLTLLAGGITAGIAVKVSGWGWAALPGMAFGVIVPILLVVQKKRRRLRAFEKQFPDALDILTGALRAGLAFSGAIQVVAEECPAPVSKEFTIVFEENRLGLDMKEALRNLAGRIDSSELRMFVTAVILQRETGGNLAEILEGTAHIIRERFRILGEVRALTAQQRFSGGVLSLLPLAMAGLTTVMAPEYMKTLLDDPMGPYLIMGALGLQLVGYLIIRRIVAIKV
jgi:tight adherence protein B